MTNRNYDLTKKSSDGLIALIPELKSLEEVHFRIANKTKVPKEAFDDFKEALGKNQKVKKMSWGGIKLPESK